MKKYFSNISKIVVLCLVLTTIMLTAFACNQDKGPAIDSNAVTKEDCVKIISETEIILFVSDKLENLENKTMYDLMEIYVEKGFMTFEASDGSWGKFITSVNGRVADDSKNEFWSIYTSDETQSSTEWDSYVYEEKTLGSSNYGCSSLMIKSGDIIVLKLSSY